MLTPSLEDYLEEIFNFSLLDDKIRIRDIAEKLHVSSPSVVKGLKRLEEDGYIVYKKYQGISLMSKGKITGASLVKRNTILKEFIQMINADCDHIKEAEACEHYLSPSTIDALAHLSTFFNQHPEILGEFLKFQKQKRP